MSDLLREIIQVAGTVKQVKKELLPLLAELKFHHRAQAKPHNARASCQYNKELADQIEKLEHNIRRLFNGR